MRVKMTPKCSWTGFYSDFGFEPSGYHTQFLTVWTVPIFAVLVISVVAEAETEPSLLYLPNPSVNSGVPLALIFQVN